MNTQNPFQFVPEKDSRIVFLPVQQHSMWVANYEVNDNAPEPTCNLCTVQGSPIVRLNLNAVVTTPKQHKKRRNQSDAYHRRIQKKWNKRALRVPGVKPVLVSLSPTLAETISNLAKTST